jgi:hypothetical protein
MVVASFFCCLFGFGDVEEGRRRGRQDVRPHHLHHHRWEERRAEEGELRFSLSLVSLSVCLSCADLLILFNLGHGMYYDISHLMVTVHVVLLIMVLY